MPITVAKSLVVDAIVKATDLLPAIPNPSAGHTMLQYNLMKSDAVDLSIYSVDGRRVKTLANGTQDAGAYRLTWDGTDERGMVVRSSVYYVRLEAGAVRKRQMLTLVR